MCSGVRTARLNNSSTAPTVRIPGRTRYLRSLGFRTVEQVSALTDDEVDELFVDGRSTDQGEFVPIDSDAVVKARTGRKKRMLQELWARYTTLKDGNPGSPVFITGGLADAPKPPLGP